MLRGLRILILIAAIAATSVVGYGFWVKLSQNVFERTSPTLIVEQFPRGLGGTPVTARFRLQDADAGLDQVIVRLFQRHLKHEILVESLEGKKEAIVTIDFKDLAKEGFQEGPAELVVKVFDKSFYSNGTEERFPLSIDKHLPAVEVLSTQHNMVAGGSQLVLYQAIDQSLVMSGVKVGNLNFLGVPIKDMDETIDQQDYFAALFSYAPEEVGTGSKPLVFAEDIVGNRVQKSFYHKVAPAKSRQISRNLSDSLILKTLPRALKRYAESEEAKKAAPAELAQQLEFLLATVRQENLLSVIKEMSVLRERFFKEPFLQMPGTAVEGYGNVVKYFYKNQFLVKQRSEGFRIAMQPNAPVLASNEGIVAFSVSNAYYGRVVGVDHGLGLYSVYGNLDQVLVAPGERVTQGQTIATIGATGFAAPNELIFEMKLQGVSVDPVEWWEKGWFFSHIEGKLNDLKRQLGLPIKRARL